MKPVMLALFIILVPVFHLNAQIMAVNEVSFIQNKQVSTFQNSNFLSNYSEHKVRGSGGMEVGVILIGVGGALFVAGLAANNRDIDATELYGLMIAGAGVDVLLVSGIVYLVNVSRGSGSHHYSIVGNKNQLGLAYNFR